MENAANISTWGLIMCTQSFIAISQKQRELLPQNIFDKDKTTNQLTWVRFPQTESLLILK